MLGVEPIMKVLVITRAPEVQAQFRQVASDDAVRLVESLAEGRSTLGDADVVFVQGAQDGVLPFIDELYSVPERLHVRVHVINDSDLDSEDFFHEGAASVINPIGMTAGHLQRLLESERLLCAEMTAGAVDPLHRIRRALALGRNAMAEMLARALAPTPGNQRLLAQALFQQNRFAEAAAIRDVLARSSRNASDLLDHAIACVRLGQWERAEASLEKALAAHSAGVDTLPQARMLLAYLRELRRADRPEGARPRLIQLLAFYEGRLWEPHLLAAAGIPPLEDALEILRWLSARMPEPELAAAVERLWEKADAYDRRRLEGIRHDRG